MHLEPPPHSNTLTSCHLQPNLQPTPILTGDLKSKIDHIWNAFWSGGIANPIEVIEQITYRDSLGQEQGPQRAAQHVGGMLMKAILALAAK